jgi:5'-methylthioadenosine phosphorylase
MTKVPILGVLGGTSLQNLPMVESKRLQRRITPFGKAGLEFTQGTLSNHSQLIFANRHGFGHRKNPSIINYRAIIWRMKQLGVTHLLSVSAVGSLREEIVPGDTFVIPWQTYDHTKGLRKRSFFQDDLAVHVAMADPICQTFALALEKACQSSDIPQRVQIETKRPYVVIEGPQYGTRAESNVLRNLFNGSVVGMTATPEDRLTREALLCYAVLAMPADYDAWRTGETAVDADAVHSGMQGFGDSANRIIETLAGNLPPIECSCRHALDGFAVHTNLDIVDAKDMTDFNFLLGR